MASRGMPDKAHVVSDDSPVVAPQPRNVRVVIYGRDDCDAPDSHQGVTLKAIGERVARLADYTFAGCYDAAAHRSAEGRLYFVPADTLNGIVCARQLGIASHRDLFGGVVPHAFVGTKAITHGLVAPDAQAPAGWSEAFAARIRPHVLPGFTAFSVHDARRAGQTMLRGGKVRVKQTSGAGGLGQKVVGSSSELEAALDALEPSRIEQEGIVLERNLDDVTTFSVGQVEIGELRASYCGTQYLTTNHAGEKVYGGSTLRVVRGTLSDLLAHPIEVHLREAVQAASAYHVAAVDCFRGTLVSRCNYDVAMGTSNGQTLLGVLEQSWRVGGATGAELAALAAFRANPECRRATASTREIYQADARLPAGADVYFQGEDRSVGALTKYAILESVSDGHT